MRYILRVVTYFVLLAVTAATFLYSEAWTSMLLLVIMVAVPVICGVVCVFNAGKNSYEILAPEEAVLGNDIELVVRDTGGVISVNYTVRLEVDCGGGEIIKWDAELFGGEQRVLRVKPRHAGVVRCSSGKSYVYDVLGLLRFRLAPVRDTVTCVLPRPVPPVPAPEYTSVMPVAFLPKYGGGFAEVHEMRDYRPGDSMRDVHWKLSVKSGELVVREPQEPVRTLVVVTVDMTAPCDRLDEIIARLLWVTQWLQSSGVEHEVRWTDPDDHSVRSLTVTPAQKQTVLMRALFEKPVTHPLPSMENMPLAGVDWHYHVSWEVCR